MASSAAGNASHTPFMPNRYDSANAQSMIATKPRETDARNAHLADSVALRIPVPTILNPAKRKPVKYSRSPVTAYTASSAFPSLLNTAVTGSATAQTNAMISTENTMPVPTPSRITFRTDARSPFP